MRRQTGTRRRLARRQRNRVSSVAPPGPTPAQQRILDAYFVNPNAAAVARSLGASERNVRRICARFADQLAERDRERDAERRARADARQAKIDDWADRDLDATLEGIDRLAASDNPAVAIRALRMKLDIARRGGIERRLISDDPEMVELREAKKRDLKQRLRGITGADDARFNGGAG